MKWIDKYRGFAISIWIILLPFWDFGAGIFLGISFLISCLSFPGFRSAWRYSSLPWLLYGLAVFGSIWTLSIDIKYLYRLLPFALIPIAVNGHWKFIRTALPIGGIILCIYLINGAVISFVKTGDLSLIFYREFTGSLHQHVYLISYLVLGIISVFDLRLKLIYRIFFLIICMITIGIMGSKIGIFAMLFSSIPLLIGRIKEINPRYYFILVLIFGTFLLSQKFAEGRDMGHVFKPISPFWATGSFDTRIVQGQTAIQVWSNNKLRGVGPLKSQEELISEYARIDYRFGLKRGLNVHNQFLQYLSTYGLLGLLWITLAVIIVYRQNFLKSSMWIRKKGIAWILFFGCLFLTESYLERSLGITTWVLGWLWVIQDSENSLS